MNMYIVYYSLYTRITCIFINHIYLNSEQNKECIEFATFLIIVFLIFIVNENEMRESNDSRRLDIVKSRLEKI